MKRYIFTMRLKKGAEEEYRRRHDALWPEMKQIMLDSGIVYYSISLDPATNILYAIQFIDEAGKSAEGVRHNPAVRRWSQYMSDIVESDADGNQILNPLEEMFYFER